MLKIVFSHDAVAGALGVARQRHVFLRHMLGGAADLHIGTGAVIGPGQRIGALAVEIVIIAAAPASAFILLS